MGPIEHAIPFTCLNQTFLAKHDLSLAFTMLIVFLGLLLVHVLAVVVPFLTCLYLIFFDKCCIPAKSTREPTFISIQLIRARIGEGKLPLCFKERAIGPKSSCVAWTMAVLITFFVNIPACLLLSALVSFIAWWVLPWLALLWVFIFVSRIWYYTLS